LNEKNSFLFDLDKRGDFEERVLYAKNNELEARKRAEGALENVKNYTWEKRVDNIIKSLRFFIIKSSQKN